MLTAVILDIFGGEISQVAEAINVDVIAKQGVRASALAYLLQQKP